MPRIKRILLVIEKGNRMFDPNITIKRLYIHYPIYTNRGATQKTKLLFLYRTYDPATQISMETL